LVGRIERCEVCELERNAVRVSEHGGVGTIAVKRKAVQQLRKLDHALIFVVEDALAQIQSRARG